MNNISITTARPFLGANDINADVGVAAKAERTEMTNLSITTGTFAAPGEISEATDPAVEASLRRDDALGQLVTQALNLPAPPMPSFD